MAVTEAPDSTRSLAAAALPCSAANMSAVLLNCMCVRDWCALA